jgi:hypothetical protein
MLCLRRALETIRLFVGGVRRSVVLGVFLRHGFQRFEIALAREHSHGFKTILEGDHQLNSCNGIAAEFVKQHLHEGCNFIATLFVYPFVFSHFASLAFRSSKRHSPFFPELAGGKA